jgi:AcrR family transcriptional regulator
MTTPMRADARRNYEKLVSIAEAIFSHNGAAVPLEQIAKKAGVGIGTLYRHFPSRKDLLLAVYVDHIDLLVQEAHALSRKSPPVTAFSTWLQNTVDYAVKNSGFGDLVALLAHDSHSPLTEAATDLLENAQKAGLLRSDVTAAEILQFVQGITNNPSQTDRDRMQKMLSVVIDGLRVK